MKPASSRRSRSASASLSHGAFVLARVFGLSLVAGLVFVLAAEVVIAVPTALSLVGRSDLLVMAFFSPCPVVMVLGAATLAAEALDRRWWPSIRVSAR